MTQLSFRASPVSIDADTTEISACQNEDGRTDRQTAFQLYIIERIVYLVSVALKVPHNAISEHQFKKNFLPCGGIPPDPYSFACCAL